MKSPSSPGIPRSMSSSSTPGLTPYPSARKKRVTSSTTLFDIDNIVIPHSIASCTRLEKLEYKEIITPSWRLVGVGGMEENQGCSTPENMEMEEEEEDVSDAAFEKRHSRSEVMEKKRFSNFITGNNHRKRTHRRSVTAPAGESAGLGGVNLESPAPAANGPTAASPISNAEPDVMTLLPDVLPWQQRTFPLSKDDEHELDHPPPPLPRCIPVPSSPLLSHLHASTPSHSTSCNTSAFNTPLTSPLSTPGEGTPASSPAEWVVNSHLRADPSVLLQDHPHQQQQQQQLRALPATMFSQHQPIILKLTKKS